MVSSASSAYVFQSHVLALCFGLLFCWFACSAQAAQPGSGWVTSGINLYTIQLGRNGYMPTVTQTSGVFGNKLAPVYTTGGPARDDQLGHLGYIQPDSLPDKIRLGSTSSWIVNILWNMRDTADRATLAPHLRIQSRETRIEFVPNTKSVLMIWHRPLD